MCFSKGAEIMPEICFHNYQIRFRAGFPVSYGFLEVTVKVAIKIH